MLTEIKSDLAKQLSALLSLSEEQVFSLLETPKNRDFGQLALPVFRFSKQEKLAPPQLAEKWSDVISSDLPAALQSASNASGFVNFQIKSSVMQEQLKRSVLSGSLKASTYPGKGQRVVIDYSSPNVAKPMNIGHLRATVIGKAIVNLCKEQGYEVVGVNHLGDWGTQFGKLAWAYQQWSSEYDFVNNAFESLYALYVRFHEEAEKDPKLDELGAATFKQLEDGDPEVVKLWKWFVEISLEQYNLLWARLGVKHEEVLGESFYNDKLQETVDLIRDKGLLVESKGAMVVEMDDPKSPPCLITKSDGASLYATRDVASAIYRHDHLKGDLLLYVVGVEQTLHFKQVFEVVRKLGFEWAQSCHHIGFGLYQFKDGRMSSRKGKMIAFAEVLEKAVRLVEEVIEAKNPELENKKEVAEQVGVGAIIFNDLMNDRVKSVEFDWDKVLDFEGNSGPYVQYSNVRCLSVLRKAGVDKENLSFSIDLDSVGERELMRMVLCFDQVLLDSFESFKPHILASYLLDLCRQFSSFYSQNKIIGAEPKVQQSRLALVAAVQKTLEYGLRVLNIQSPSQM